MATPRESAALPELPEVETTCRGIAPHIVGQTIAAVIIRQPQLRWPITPGLARALQGQTVLGVSRRGKYVLVEFATGTLLMHLGMSGSLSILPADQPPLKHDHFDLVFISGQALRFTDPRRFGAALWTTEPIFSHSLLAHLGPEPLTNSFHADYLFAHSRKRQVATKQFIMDSKIVVGVGNIYANEALFLSGIRPRRAAGRLSREQTTQLVTNIKAVLARAIAMGGTTLRDFTGSDGKPGYFKQQLYVYGRGGEPCVNCQAVLKEVRLGQRSTVYCAHCQR